MTERNGSGNRIFPPRPGVATARALAGPATPAAAAPAANTPAAPRPQATETIARRAGAMVNEIDFPGFVAQLVHGTFDAIVDASIRQMESYSSLVTSVAKTLEQFTEENVTPNQARDWLATRYPGDVQLLLPDGGERLEPRLVPRSDDLEPAWLADFGIEGEVLSAELLEERIVPQVRLKVGGERQQLLATMVMLGMNRVVVRDGSITSKVMFRAAAQDAAKVGYAAGTDPKAVANWGERGSLSYEGQSSTMVSTVAVNAQNESNVRADLFGEVKLNFVSETLPLDRMVEPAKAALVQRHSPAMRPAAPPQVTAPAAPAAPEGAPAAGGTG
ncbi:hypothetical protein [Marilutibacter spongiae]|uniref:Uncharacterized protein n=1 Tax=Marilutibacter spongiae TaxID=2025720 RepID=A0A7W3TLL3_9GAMM|nr:hypothetical protein [Lysobacter spongiae]MBB1060603.1 hypothetical protein [Lysobacter spongiae]